MSQHNQWYLYPIGDELYNVVMYNGDNLQYIQQTKYSGAMQVTLESLYMYAEYFRKENLKPMKYNTCTDNWISINDEYPEMII